MEEHPDNAEIHLSRWIPAVFHGKSQHPGEWGRKGSCVCQPISFITNQCESMDQSEANKFCLTHLQAIQSTRVGCFMLPKTSHISSLQAFICIFKMHNFNSNKCGEKKNQTRIQEWACIVIHAYIQISLIPMALRHLDANFRTKAWFIKVLKARNRTYNHFEYPSRSLIFIISHLTASLQLAQFSAASKGCAEAHHVPKGSPIQAQLAQPRFSALSLVSDITDLDRVEKNEHKAAITYYETRVDMA